MIKFRWIILLIIISLCACSLEESYKIECIENICFKIPIELNYSNKLFGSFIYEDSVKSKELLVYISEDKVYKNQIEALLKIEKRRLKDRQMEIKSIVKNQNDLNICYKSEEQELFSRYEVFNKRLFFFEFSTSVNNIEMLEDYLNHFDKSGLLIK